MVERDYLKIKIETLIMSNKSLNSDKHYEKKLVSGCQ